MRRILLVDDDIQVLKALQRALLLQLRDDPPGIEYCTDPFAALERICQCDFDLVICDYMMPRLNGAELLQALRDVAPDTVRIMLSASDQFDTVLSAINQAQAFRFLRKPWDPQELGQQVKLALAQRASQRPATPQEQEARRLEAEEPGLLQVRRDADGSIIL